MKQLNFLTVVDARPKQRLLSNTAQQDHRLACTKKHASMWQNPHKQFYCKFCVKCASKRTTKIGKN